MNIARIFGLMFFLTGSLFGGSEYVSEKKARGIMGSNFFGVREAIRYFGVKPTKAQLVILSTIPFGKQELEKAMDTHILVATFPISLLDIRMTAGRRFFYSKNHPWYRNHGFANSMGHIGWYLVRKTIVPKSINKSWDEQQGLLTMNKRTPSIRVMVYTIIGHYLKTGERLFENVYVRCSDLDDYGYRVVTGYFHHHGMHILTDWYDKRFPNFGLASSKSQVF